MNHWLMKSEPDVFSIDDLQKRKVSGWDGVRNYSARLNLKAMKRGDRAFFYHSSTGTPAIVGEMQVVRQAYPDQTQFHAESAYFDPAATPENPRWFQVDVRFVKKFARPLTLPKIKATPPLKGMALLKYGRLSVQPVTAAEWTFIQKAVK